MQQALKRDPKRPGRVGLVDAARAKGDGVFFCPVCAETVFLVSPLKSPGELRYRPAYFKHKNRDLCDTEYCRLRVEGSAPARTNYAPLVLRQAPNGGYSFCVGFHGFDRVLLRRMADAGFVEVAIAHDGVTAAVIPLSELLQSEGTVFAELEEAVRHTDDYRVEFRKPGHIKATEGLGIDRIDGFADDSCSGAAFIVVRRSVMEKLPVGTMVEAGQELVLAERLTPGQETRESLLRRYGVKTLALGAVKPRNGIAPYLVYSARLPRSSDGKRYTGLAEELREKFGIVLCDQVPKEKQFHSVLFGTMLAEDGLDDCLGKTGNHGRKYEGKYENKYF